MNISDFIDVIEYIKEIFPNAKMPSKDILIDVWYEPFKKMSVKTAKEMVSQYFRSETKDFNYARMLKNKPEQRINASAYEPFKYDN